MKNNIIIWMVAGLVAFAVSALAQDNNCLTCHQDFEDEDGPAHKIVRDIHYQKGLLCNDCHGGDPTLEDMDDVRNSKGYHGVPSHFEVPKFCASCHSNARYMHEHNPSLPTDQFDKYKTSKHGQLLFGKKDTKVANCVSCHSVHEIGDAKMPHSSTHPLNVAKTCGKCHADPDYMAEYNIPTTQVQDYLESVHGKALNEDHDLGAPTCNDCHGNHGAAPPGVGSLAAVCGNCHAFQAELFNRSPHKEAFVENDFPMCETCHSNHNIKKPTDEMVGAEEPAVCVRCHESGDGTKGLETAAAMAESIKELVSVRDEAKAVLANAQQKGMMTTDEEFALKDVEQILIQTRTLVHSFNKDEVVVKAKEGLEKAKIVEEKSTSLIDEYFFRRKGLIISSLFITILAIGLYFKIRKLK